MKKQSISAAAFEDAFDRGEDILPLVDLSKAMRPGLKIRQLSVDFPSWIFVALKERSARRGISCEQLILAYIAERLGADGG